jgi:hypothetical protein
MSRFRDARLQLHWAAQPAAAVGRTLLPHRDDFSEESFQWSAALGALVQKNSGIRLRDMTQLLLDDRGRIIDELAMNGRTLDEGYSFYEHHFNVRLTRPAEGPPSHPVGGGARFDADREDLERLHDYFENADANLKVAARREQGASAVVCWPHHFDIATLIMLDPAGETARTIGVGMVPGDSGIADPYYYVTPWPYPKSPSLPPLSAGEWHSEGWFGAFLLAEPFDGRIARFLSEAVERCRALIMR